MGQKFPQADYKNIIKIAKKLGFYFYRQGKGSHEIWRRNDGRYTTIQRHGSKIIKRKTFKSILDDLEITPQEFTRLQRGI